MALTLLFGASAAVAQMQSITTYGGSGGMQTATISPTYGGGYNYTTFGGPNSGSWGGVSASPGTTIQAAIGEHGNVVPIVSTVPASVVEPAPDPALVSAQIAAANAQELAADFQLLQSLPATRHGAPPVRVARAIPVEQNKQYPKPRPAPPNSSAYYQYAFLHNQLTPEGMRLLAKDWKADSQQQQGRFDPHALLAYVTIWVRYHPEFIQLPTSN